MNLYIQVVDGAPVNHPNSEDNLVDAYERVPETWEPFVRSSRPVPRKYQFVSDLPVGYTKNTDGVWTDFYEIREMTFEEKTAVDQAEVDELKRVITRAKVFAKKDNRIKYLTERLQTSQDAEEFQLLLQVLNATTNHVFTSFDPIEPPFVKFPKQDENGHWYIPE